MKRNHFLRIVRWFCSIITFNELASAVLIFHEILSGKETSYKLKEEEVLPHYRDYRTSYPAPLESPVSRKIQIVETWQELKSEIETKTGKTLRPVKRHSGKADVPSGCICQHCGAPKRYLYLNNGKIASQVVCKICKQTSPIGKTRRESKAKYWCPHCGYALSEWKSKVVFTAYKCPNKKCSYFTKNYRELKPTEKKLFKEKPSQFKLHYQFRKYNFTNIDLSTAKFEEKPKINLNKIHNDIHIVSLVLSYTISLGLSSRQTVEALKRIHSIEKISHQTVLNYAQASAFLIRGFVDRNMPKPEGIAATDETYIIVDGKQHYTWFLEDSETKAICGYNLSNNRKAESAIALLCSVYGKPESHIKSTTNYTLVTDGNPSYDTAVMAYNTQAGREVIKKKTVIGLQNLDKESEEYRRFKQLIERLNRTYKFHTRPRAGFKTFNGALVLTILFIAFYNFMRIHSTIKEIPIKLECLKGLENWPKMWATLLANA